MIFIGNIRDVKAGEYDEVWMIVRSWPGAGKSKWIQHVPALSPSWKLHAEQQAMVLNGEWNKENFDAVFAPKLIEEMHRSDARQALNDLVVKDRKGKNIALVCFCVDEDTCHRRVIAGLLQGAGASVYLRSRKDYSVYFNQYTGENKE